MAGAADGEEDIPKLLNSEVADAEVVAGELPKMLDEAAGAGEPNMLVEDEVCAEDPNDDIEKIFWPAKM